MSVKTLLISEGNVTYDGRLIELFNVMKSIGDTTIITLADSENDLIAENHYILKRRYTKLKRLVYAIEGYQIAKRLEFNTLFIDNTSACFLGYFIMKFIKPKKVILDLRELHLKDEIRGWKSRVIHYFEQKVMQNANVVICANNYRADVMKNEYVLSKLPIVFENIRIIKEMPETDPQYEKQLEKKGITRIISTGGLHRDRARPIIEAMKALGKDYELYILGGGSQTDVEQITQQIQDLNLRNVYLIGKRRRSVMRNFIQKCDIGVVYYSGINMNEKLCACGKLYEYMQESKPFVGANLLPLVELCNTYGVGECSDNLADAIVKVKEKYFDYQRNVNIYINQVSVEANNQGLVENIKKQLEIL